VVAAGGVVGLSKVVFASDGLFRVGSLWNGIACMISGRWGFYGAGFRLVFREDERRGGWVFSSAASGEGGLFGGLVKRFEHSELIN
jgi:hypothetical protein